MNPSSQACRVDNVRHVGIVVSDLSRALSFYVGALGMELGSGGEESGPELERILGIAGVRIWTQKLLSKKRDTRIELIEFLHPERISSPPKQIGSSGITHIAITVNDIDGLYRAMCAAGIEFVAPPELAASGVAKVAFCRDVDGNLLELIEDCPA
jgi:catechol 2,3-dioxygenase-like lactoylglutathione lyase family enzyme